jgi:tetratricopeptide (TPR) repeat protein
MAAAFPAMAQSELPGSSPLPAASTHATAAELTRQGIERVRTGDELVAVRRFAEAIALDPGYGPAYLELAAARERAGDYGEAERTYGVAMARIPQYVAALRARAALYGRLGQADKELTDLETAARFSEEPDILAELAQRYVAARAWPAALAVWRRSRVHAEMMGDEQAARAASIHVRALAILAAELDPVALGATSRDWVRRAEASVARRLGI